MTLRLALACLFAAGSTALPIASARDGTGPAAGYPLPCRYILVELDRHEGCARADGETLRIAPSHLGRLRFHRGLAEIAVDGFGWLWVRRDGLALLVFLLDNGPDPFRQGLVRGWHRGKVAFYDRRLRLALATAYDWSYPFNDRGEALACLGCRSDGRVPASMIGGRWNLVDRSGRTLEAYSESGAALERYLSP